MKTTKFRLVFDTTLIPDKFSYGINHIENRLREKHKMEYVDSGKTRDNTYFMEFITGFTNDRIRDTIDTYAVAYKIAKRNYDLKIMGVV